jgi:hypothetical protein
MNADIRANYIAAAVRSHNAATIAERADAERTATHIARSFGIDEIAMEADVLAAVYATYTDAELAKAAASPVTRAFARAEIARRAA